jgi:hypothetical protein
VPRDPADVGPSSPTPSHPPSSLSYPTRRCHDASEVYTFADLRALLRASRERTRGSPELPVFYEMLGILERERCERLWASIGLLAHGEEGEARREAEALARGLPDEEDGHDATLARTFAEAILARLDRRDERGGNLYLGARPPGAQLRAFELLRLRTPLIPFAYAAANRALLDAVDEPADVTLIDVGIGRGGQVRALLKNPTARRLLRSLHVIGIEPDSSPDTGGALELAQANVLSAAEEAHIPATFAPIPKLAEALTLEDLRAAGPRGLVLANASLALHHIGLVEDGARQSRDAVLGLLRAVGVAHLVLVEPDSDHYQDDLPLRFLYAYRHYGALSRSLYRTLSAADASLVWREFFAAEVGNVMTHDGRRRVERHEEIETWCRRLTGQGFRLDTPAELVAPSAAPPGFDVAPAAGACTLRYEGVSVLGVMRATPT